MVGVGARGDATARDHLGPFSFLEKGPTTVLTRVFRQVGEIPLENLVQLVEVVLNAPLCSRERVAFAAILLGHRRRALITAFR